MGALPKNKITRVERGKRRRGNTPKITKDVNVVQVALHKRGLVASILKQSGLGGKTKSDKQAKDQAKQTSSTTPVATPHLTDRSQAVKNVPSGRTQSVKSTRKTQHKG